MPFGLLSPFRFFSLSEQAVDCDMTIMPEQLLLQHRDDDREKMVHCHDCTRLVGRGRGEGGALPFPLWRRESGLLAHSPRTLD